MHVNTVNVKNLLIRSKLPDADFVINPYIGCNHGCVYCYAEFISRFTGHGGEKWGSFMDVKQCDKPMPQRNAGESILIGSTTDPYNPLEKRYEKTRTILSQLQNSNSHVEILTKSPLVTRDIDILSRMKDVSVGISASTTDEDFARLTERHAATPQQRFEAMRTLKKAGIPVYAFMSPIFPYLSDWRHVVDKVSRHTDFICFENLNLRGSYKSAVLNLIKQHYPQLAEEFGEIYRDKKIFSAYWRKVEAEIRSYMTGKPHKIYFFHEEIRKN